MRPPSDRSGGWPVVVNQWANQRAFVVADTTIKKVVKVCPINV